MSDKIIYVLSCTESGGVYSYSLSKNNELKKISQTVIDRPMYAVTDNGRLYVILREPFKKNKESGIVSFKAENGILTDKTDLISTKGEVCCHLCVSNGEVLAVLKRGDKFFMWFGDATPLLFLSIKPSKRNPTSLMYGLSAGFVIIGFVLMNAIYGNASEYVVNLVVKVAGFNQFSDVLGRLDWTGIIVWLMLAVIYISTYLWASGEALKSLFKGKKNIVIVLTVIGVGAMTILKKDIRNTLDFVTGGARWYVAATNYVLPVALIVYAEVRKRKSAKIAPAKEAVGESES